MIKEKIITFRVTEKQHKQLKVMAQMYALGDVSVWIRHCLDQYKPKMIKKTRRKPKSTPGLRK